MAQSRAGRFAILVAVLWLALLCGASRWTRFQHPLGLDADSARVALSVTAARNFEKREWIDSGGYPTVKPFPVPAEEGIQPGLPPLYAWTIRGLSSLTGLDEAVSARVIEAVALFLSTIAILIAGTRARGLVAGVAGASTAWIVSEILTKNGLVYCDGYLSLLSCCVYMLACIEAVKSKWLLACSLTAVAALGVGLSGSDAPMMSALVFFWIALLFLRGRNPSLLGLFLLFLVPLLTTIVAWVVDASTLHEEYRFWYPKGSKSLGPPLFYWAVIFVVVDVGLLDRRWPRIAIAIATALSLTPLALISRTPPVASVAHEVLSTSIRKRVGFGESFDSNFGDSAVLEALTGRPKNDVNLADPNLEAIARRKRFPVSWYFVMNGPEASPRAIEECKRVADDLKARFEFERDIMILAFDLHRPRPAGVASCPSNREPVNLDVSLAFNRDVRVRFPQFDGVARWRVVVGYKPLHDHATYLTKESLVPTGEAIVKLTDLHTNARRLYVHATALDESGRELASSKEICVLREPLDSLRSKAILLIPLFAIFFAAASFLAVHAFRGAAVKTDITTKA